MPARGIFLKIYLCFWLVMVLVIAAQVGLDFMTHMGPFGGPPGHEYFERTVVPTLKLYGNLAVRSIKQGDNDALSRSAEEFKESSGIRVFLTDSSGKTLGPGVVPSDAQTIAKEAGDARYTRYKISKDRALIAVPLHGSDEKDYCVIGDIPGSFFNHGPHGPGPAPAKDSPPPGGHFAPPPPHHLPIISPLVFIPPPGHPPYFWLRILCTLFISGCLCYLLARYLTSPIVKLRDAARLFVQGDLSARAAGGKVRWKDEISSMNEDFNVMAVRLESLITQQQRLIRDISHELRSPLARLTIATELVRRQDSAVSASTIDRIEKETAELNTMIGQVLDLSRFESTAGYPEMASLDIVDLLEEIIDDANFEAGSRNCSVHFLNGCESCLVRANEEWLRRGIENVVRNAVRYTRERSAVEVSLEKISGAEGNCVRISVRDNGDGVPESDLPNIFRPFYRVSSSRDRKSGGTGLGLAITERAVALHKGIVAAENAPGGGLVITIQIPVE